MGITHLPILLILAMVALIVFGPKRLPELGHELGKAITEFKKGSGDLMSSHEADVARRASRGTAPDVDHLEGLGPSQTMVGVALSGFVLELIIRPLAYIHQHVIATVAHWNSQWLKLQMAPDRLLSD